MSFAADITFLPKVNSLAVTPAGHILAWTFRASVYRSTNEGDTWALDNLTIFRPIYSSGLNDTEDL